MLRELNKTNTTIHDLFLYFKICCVKKIKYVSKEDTNQFWFKKKIRFASKEDAHPFLFWEKFKSTYKEDADPFFYLRKKKSNM